MSKERVSWPYVLLIAALMTDLLTPLFIWKGILPAEIRWASHLSVAGMLFAAYVLMVLQNQIPKIVPLIAFYSATGVAVAYLSGQGIVATVWGWWVMFQFPLVGLFAYLLPTWPDSLVEHLRTGCLVTLGVQVLVQLGQLATGEIPGDNLAGLFGRHGTSNLVMFIIFSLALCFGHWIASGNWHPLVWGTALGMASSILGEMKLFPVALLALGAVAAVFVAYRARKLGRLIKYSIVLIGIIVCFALIYDKVILSVRNTRSLASFLQRETLEGYLGGAGRVVIDGRYYYDMGRNYALAYGWRQIATDPVTLLFGMGLGARGESQTLGTAGSGLQSQMGLSSGTSLLVMLQETGLVGMLVLFGVLAWILITLLRDIGRHPDSKLTAVRYGLLLYSLFWPVWVWYTSAWTLRAPMLLYWATLGYTLAETRRASLVPASRPARTMTAQPTAPQGFSR